MDIIITFDSIITHHSFQSFHKWTAVFTLLPVQLIWAGKDVMVSSLVAISLHWKHSEKFWENPSSTLMSIVNLRKSPPSVFRPQLFMMLTLYHINLRYFQLCLLLLLCLKILQWLLFTLHKDQNSQHSLWSPASFYRPFPEHILLSVQGFFSHVLRRASFSEPESFVHAVPSAWSSLLSSLPNYALQIPVYLLVFCSKVLKEFFSVSLSHYPEFLC